MNKTRIVNPITNLARDLRQRSTDVELKLWYHLRNRRFYGYKFRRQKRMGKYIADFVCNEEKLIIELDGGQHATTVEFDQLRTNELSSSGYRVIRFWNNEVLENLDGVLNKIKASLKTPSPCPLPQALEGN